MKLYFKCPECGEIYTIDSYWKWLFTTYVHCFDFVRRKDYRRTKCPHCGKKSFVAWKIITRK
jgi:predicted RNA-binding Zn-ribbon protein involved in translation (DUF1610 family)